MSQRSKWSLIGIPDHQGVLNVGGRAGAARGPELFRKELHRLKGIDPVLESLKDCGDVSPLGGDVLENLERAAQTIRNGHPGTGLSVIVGGGHDHGFSHLQGISRANPGKKIGCINIDAHLDLRKPNPVVTSGSPFYLAIESKILEPHNFVEFGIQSHCNASELWKYVEENKIKVIPFEDLRHAQAGTQFRSALKKLSARCDIVVVSLDLDAASVAYAPGVSAPQVEGFTSSEILEMVEAAGDTPEVVSLGIFELNPEHDPDLRTAKLAAVSAYHFIARALRRS